MRPKLYGRRHPCHPGSRLRIIYHPDLDQGQGGRQLQQFRMLIDSFLDARCWMLDTGQRSARRPTLLYLLRVAGSSNVEFGHLSSVFGHLSSVLCLPSSVLCFLSSAIRHLSSVIRQPVPGRFSIGRLFVPSGLNFSRRRRWCTAQTRNSFFQGWMGRKQAHQTASR